MELRLLAASLHHLLPFQSLPLYRIIFLFLQHFCGAPESLLVCFRLSIEALIYHKMHCVETNNQKNKAVRNMQEKNGTRHINNFYLTSYFIFYCYMQSDWLHKRSARDRSSGVTLRYAIFNRSSKKPKITKQRITKNLYYLLVLSFLYKDVRSLCFCSVWFCVILFCRIDCLKLMNSMSSKITNGKEYFSKTQDNRHSV